MPTARRARALPPSRDELPSILHPAIDPITVLAIELQAGAKTTTRYWDDRSIPLPSTRFWSPFDPTFSDMVALLTRHVRPGDRVLEIGFAPGKHLAFAALKCGARVSGIDYSPAGIATAREYFRRLGISADLRCEDIFSTSLEPGLFDIVFSNGLIEHFDDPRPIVQTHLDLCRPGGKVIILIPNYLGLYGWLQARLEPENLAIHNLDIMTPEALAGLFPYPVETFRYGRPSPWTVAFRRPTLQKIMAICCRLLPRSVSPAKPLLCAIAVKAA